VLRVCLIAAAVGEMVAIISEYALPSSDEAYARRIGQTVGRNGMVP
jgi:hypothetical protein